MVILGITLMALALIINFYKQLNTMRYIILTLALMFTLSSYGQSKQDKKVIKKLELEIINRGLDLKGKFISKDSYKCGYCKSVESNWNNSLFKAGLRTGTWYIEDGVEIYDGDYVFEIYQQQITIYSVKDDFETVATISFPGNLGFINFQNKPKNIEQRAVVLRSLIESNRIN